MPGKFVISLTHGLNDTDKATVAFVVANAAVASDKDTVVFLSIEGTRLSQKGVADAVHDLAPLQREEVGIEDGNGAVDVGLDRHHGQAQHSQQDQQAHHSLQL